MPYFLAIGMTGPESSETREKHRADHRAYARENADQTRLAGALLDEVGVPRGTVKIFEAQSIEEVRKFYASEPFFQAGVYSAFHILEWRPGFNALPPIGSPD